MAISDLNFSVILNTKDFDTKINKVREKALALNRDLSTILDIGRKVNTNTNSVREFTEALKGAQKAMGGLNKAGSKIPTMGVNIKQTTTQVKGFNTSLQNSSNLLRTVAQLTGVAFSAVTIRRFVSDLVEVTGNLEMQRKAIDHILGSSEKGEMIFEQLKELTKPSIFTLPDLTKFSKQLAALSIPYEELYDTTKMLGDVSAGLGVSFDRIALAYGHIRSMGFLRGMQARQLTNAGIPIFEELSKNLTEAEGKLVSISEVYDRMAKRQITFEMVRDVFKQMTDEGGKFYDMQIALTDTLAGRINKLKGVWQIALSDLGNANSGTLKGAVNSLIKIVENLDKIAVVIKPVIKGFGVYYGTLLTINALSRLFGFTDAFFRAQANGVNFMTFAMQRYGGSLKVATAAAGAFLAALGFLIVEIVRYKREANEAASAVAAFQGNLKRETAEMKSYMDALAKATLGTKEYREAKDALLEKYGTYLSEVDKEKIAIGDLAGIYDRLAESIRQVAAQQAKSASEDRTKEAIEKANKKVANSLSNYVGSKSPIYEELLQYIYGVVGKEGLSAEAKKALGGVADMDSMTGKETRLDEIVEQFRTGYNKTLEEINKQQQHLFDALRSGQSTKTELDFKEALALGSANLVASDAELTEGKKRILDWQLDVIKEVEKQSTGKDKEAQLNIARLLGYGTERDWEEYRQGISKKYDDTTKKLEGEYRESERAIYQADLDAITALDSVLGGHLLAGNKTLKRENKDEETDAQKAAKKAERETRAQIQLLLKYKDARDKLRDYLPKSGDAETDNALLSATMSALFGTSMGDVENIEGEIISLADRLSKFGESAAAYGENVKAGLGKDVVDTFIKHGKAIEQYDKLKRKWEKDWGGNFLGIDADVDKVRKDLENQNKAIDDEYTDAIKAMQEAHAGNADAITEETERLKELADARKAAALASAQDKLNDIAAKYVKDKTKGLNLSDWGDKSIGQVREIWRTLSEMVTADIAIDENLKAELGEAGLTLDKFVELAKKGFKDLSDEAKVELNKKLGDVFSELASQINSIVNGLGDLAEASGRADLKGAATLFSSLLSTAASVAKDILNGNIIGAVSAAVTGVITLAIQGSIEMAKLRARIAEAREEARMLSLEQGLSLNTKNIFGSSDTQKVRNAIRTMRELRSLIEADNEQVNASNGKKGSTSRWRSTSLQSVSYLMRNLGYDVYDENGLLNTAGLQAVLDTYKDLSKEQTEFINQAINNADKYAEALAVVRDVTEQIVGDIASSSADSLVDSWWEAGNAALNYADILDDVAKSYAKMITQSFLIDKVFTKDLQDEIVGLMGDGNTEGVMARIADAMALADSYIPEIEAMLTAFEPYRNRSGSSDQTVGQGIKGITEDTANLLASYINAMRADLSQIRVWQESGWRGVSGIAAVLPTYGDHLARIAANTENSARQSAAILAELRSVIGTPGTSGNVVRVETY